MDYQFYCRASKANKKGLAPIEVSIVINHHRTIFQLDRREYPSEFKKLTECKKNNDLKTYLDIIRNKINKAVNDLMLSGQDVTSDAIKDYVKNDGIRQYTIQELIDAYLKVQKQKVSSGECTEGVYKKYVIITNHFLSHINKYKECNSITPSDIEEFYLKMRTIYVDATLSGQMFRLKSVFNYGVENKYLRTNPFKIEIKKAKPKIEYLEDEEVDTIHSFNCDNDSLMRIKDLCLFQAHSGLSYADMAQLSSDDVKTSPEGYKYVYKERQKTGVFFTAVLLPYALEVLDKYNGHLPVISNQKYNLYLKTLQDLCNIKKTLHTHLFRKTYSTTLLNKGVRLDVVSKAIGHTSTRITAATYAFMQKKTVINEIGNIIIN